MTSVTIEFNPERSRRLFREYFIYERRKLFRQLPTFVMLLLAGGFILTGIFTQISFFIYMGLATILIVMVGVLFYYFKFKIGFDRFLAGLEDYMRENKGPHILEFDEDKIVYRNDKHRNEIRWDGINSYAFNNGSLYLFHKKNQLLDIYSEDILGKKSFQELLKIVELKLGENNSGNITK